MSRGIINVRSASWILWVTGSEQKHLQAILIISLLNISWSNQIPSDKTKPSPTFFPTGYSVSLTWNTRNSVFKDHKKTNSADTILIKLWCFHENKTMKHTLQEMYILLVLSRLGPSFHKNKQWSVYKTKEGFMSRTDASHPPLPTHLISLSADTNVKWPRP